MCGASVERDRLSQSQCWCRGLFCGRGGVRATRRVRHDFHISGHATSRAQFDGLITQADLFDGSTLREKWIARLDAHAPKRKRSAA